MLVTPRRRKAGAWTAVTSTRRGISLRANRRQAGWRSMLVQRPSGRGSAATSSSGYDDRQTATTVIYIAQLDTVLIEDGT